LQNAQTGIELLIWIVNVGKMDAPLATDIKPESNAATLPGEEAASGLHGEPNVDAVAEWLPDRNSKVMVSPISAVIFEGEKVSAPPPTITWWSEEMDVCVGAGRLTDAVMGGGTKEKVLELEVVAVVVVEAGVDEVVDTVMGAEVADDEAPGDEAVTVADDVVEALLPNPGARP
jgi:hypothetical protein